MLALTQCFALLIISESWASAAPLCKIQTVPQEETQRVRDDSLAGLFSDLPTDALSRYVGQAKFNRNSSNCLPQVYTSVVDSDKQTDEATLQILKLKNSTKPTSSNQVFSIEQTTPHVSSRNSLNAKPAPSACLRNGASSNNDAPKTLLTISDKYPAGNVQYLNQITITFSKPMVSALDFGNSAQPGAATLFPSQPGLWKWADETHLIFIPKQNSLPNSTAYRIFVPAGLKSLDGSKLLTSTSWTINTPRLTAEASQCLGFDTGDFIEVRTTQPAQRISVLHKTHLIENGKEIPIRLATEKELKVYGEKQIHANQAHLFKVVRDSAAQPAKEAKIIIDRGVLPLVGNLGTERAKCCVVRRQESKSLIMPLRSELGAFEPWVINGNYDANSFTSDSIEVTPELPNLTAYFLNGVLHISGDTKPNTSYTVRLKPGIKACLHEWNKMETLTEPLVMTIKVHTANPSFVKPDPCVNLAPNSTMLFPVHSINIHKAEVSIYDAHAYLVSSWNFAAFKPLFKQTIDLDFRPDAVTETNLDLSPWLGQGQQVIVCVKKADAPFKSRQEFPRALPSRLCDEYNTWVQSTNFNLTVVQAADRGFAYLRDIRTGKPVQGARVVADTSDGRWISSKQLKFVGTTDNTGICELKNPGLESFNAGVLTALSKGEKISVLGRFGFNSQINQRFFRWAVRFDNSEIARLSEAVFFGWIRKIEDGKLSLPKNCSAQWDVFDAQQQKIASGVAKLSPLGGISARFKVPENTSCGVCWLSLKLLSGSDVIDSQERAAAFEIAESQSSPAKYHAYLCNTRKGSIKANDAVTTSIVLQNEDGSIAGNTEITWRSWLTQSEWVPPGWEDFTFSQEQPDVEAIFPTVLFQNYPKRRTDADGRSTVRSEYRAELDTVATLNVEATGPDGKCVQLATYQALPPGDLVGIEKSIEQSSEQQDVTMRFIVVSSEGKQKEGKNVRLSIRDLETGQNVFSINQISSNFPTTVKTVVPNLHRLNLVAELIEDGRTVSLANTCTQHDVERNCCSAKQEIAISSGLEGFSKVGDFSNYALIKSPFDDSTGIVVTSGDGTSSCVPIAVKRRALRTPLSPSEYPGRSLIFAKLYDASQQKDNTDAAIGELSIPGKQNFSLKIRVLPEKKQPNAGTKIAVDISVERPDTSPVSQAEVFVTASENRQPTFGQLFSDFAIRQSSSTEPDSTSTDRLKGPMPLNEASRLYRTNLHDRPQRHEKFYCGQMIFSNEPPSEKVISSVSQMLKTDADGKARAEIFIPNNAKNFFLEANAIAGDDEYGAGGSQINPIQPLKITADSPSHLFPGDSSAVILQFINIGPTPLPIKISTITGGEQINSTIGNALLKPTSATHIYVYNIQNLGNKFAVKVEGEHISNTLEFDVKQVQTDLVSKVQNVGKVSLLSALENVLEQMKSKTPDSTEQLADRIIAALTLKRLKGETTFSGCCDDAVREDICQLTKLNAQNPGWLQWINQIEPSDDIAAANPVIRSQCAQAFCLASNAGITIEDNALRRIADTLQAAVYPLETDQMTIGKSRVIANYSLMKMTKTLAKTDPDNANWMLPEIKSWNEQFMQAHKADKLDAQTASLLAMTSEETGIYPNLRAQISNRASNLCDIGPVSEKYSNGDRDLLHLSDTVSNAFLLEACCALNLGAIDKRKKLLQFLIDNLTSDGWKNSYENSVCIGAIARAIETKLVSRSEVVSVRKADTRIRQNISRAFKAGNASSKVWQDPEGKWHATRGSKIIACLNFNAFTDNRNFVLVDNFPGGVSPYKNERPEPSLTDYEGPNPYDNNWAQQLSFDKHQVKTYAYRLRPGEYTLRYSTRAVFPGIYTIPEARLTSVNYDREIQISKPDVLIIE